MTDIIAYWSPQIQNWIVFAVDADGNQLWDAQYYPNRACLAANWH